jgi:sugar lactone lactonase YvrE
VGAAEVWKSYQMSTGSRGPILKPETSMPVGDLSLSIVDAQPVRGTKLVLVHWTRIHWERQQQGARFTLIDSDGRAVWTLDLPNDYQPPDAAGSSLEAQARASRLMLTTAILDADTPREFELRQVRPSERVRFRVDADKAEGWTVQEIGRRSAPDPFAPAARAAAPAPEKPLRHLGSIKLGGRATLQNSPIRDVHDFGLDEAGRFGFVRRDGGCDLSFVSGTGVEDARSIRLGRPVQQDCSSPLVAWAGGDTWLVTLEYATAESGPAGWWIDRANGRSRPFALPHGVSSVRAIAGSPVGGVVLLAERSTADGLVIEMDTKLFRIDPFGNEDRDFAAAANGGDSELLSPDDLAVLASGEVVIVDVVRHAVAMFRSDGTFQRTIDLEKAWGREPRYTCGIAPDIDGGFIVEDFNGRTPFVRMRADGTVRADLLPRYGDGRRAGRIDRVQAGPGGVLWASDGEALLQLGDDGVVSGAVGAPANVDDLGEAAAVVLDGADRIYAVDRRTAAVHVFVSDGTLDHVCRPRTGDLEGSLTSPSLSATDDGRVFLGLDDGAFDHRGYLEYSSSGDRLTRRRWEERSRIWNPATGGFWAIRDNEVVAVDEGGRVAATVARRRDRRWLGWIAGIAVAPDGSLAVDASSRMFTSDRGSFVSLHAPNGAAIGLVERGSRASSGVLAYDGRHLAFWESGEVIVVDTAGHPIARFQPRPEGRETTDWPLFLAAQGRELWMFDDAHKTMHRYELP